MYVSLSPRRSEMKTAHALGPVVGSRGARVWRGRGRAVWFVCICMVTLAAAACKSRLRLRWCTHARVFDAVVVAVVAVVVAVIELTKQNKQASVYGAEVQCI